MVDGGLDQSGGAGASMALARRVVGGGRFALSELRAARGQGSGVRDWRAVSDLQDLGIFMIAGDRSGADGGNCRIAGDRSGADGGNCRGQGIGAGKQCGGGEAGIRGGRCGGCPPAQGRAEGPTAQIDTHPWRRVPIVGMSQARKFSGLPIGRKVAILLPEVNIICGAERPSSDRRELCRSTRSVSNIV